MGPERLKLIATFVLLSLALHLVAWSWFIQSNAVLVIDKDELDAHYITAVVTTFSVISIVVYYAFRLVEQAQAETDALLHNILPDTIVDRLKAAPETTIANEFAEASVMFADVRGFCGACQASGASSHGRGAQHHHAGVRSACRPLGCQRRSRPSAILHGGGGPAGCRASTTPERLAGMSLRHAGDGATHRARGGCAASRCASVLPAVRCWPA